jgi:hypothetical protein
MAEETSEMELSQSWRCCFATVAPAPASVHRRGLHCIEATNHTNAGQFFLPDRLGSGFTAMDTPEPI